jgi:hypothetical protein
MSSFISISRFNTSIVQMSPTTDPQIDTVAVSRGGSFEVAVVERIDVLWVLGVGSIFRTVHDDPALSNQLVDLCPEGGKCHDFCLLHTYRTVTRPLVGGSTRPILAAGTPAALRALAAWPAWAAWMATSSPPDVCGS